ncbi:MAG: DUF485 domain-containing protein [Fuerstiella sp.]
MAAGIGEEPMESKNARLGLQLFGVYLLLYGGFVLINTFAPETMEATPIAGINLAILYGFGLIVAALVLALIYGVLCQGETPESNAGNAAAATHDNGQASGSAAPSETEDGR